LGLCRVKKKFTDADVCKFYLCGFCPYEEFQRTKHDVGPCPMVHDDHCKVNPAFMHDWAASSLYKVGSRGGHSLHAGWGVGVSVLGLLLL
jgi:hypothetical protein